MDAARSVILERGARGVTIGAIASVSGAPTGSIYHRFGSVDELLARLWMRAMGRVQEAMIATDDAVGAALAVYDFCVREPEEAMLLSSFRLADFADATLPAQVRTELDHLNDTIDPMIDQLATSLHRSRDHLLLAIRDLPYGAALPYVRSGATPPAERRAALERGVRAALAS
jgi:AcrR family transcriptional regulator